MVAVEREASGWLSPGEHLAITGLHSCHQPPWNCPPLMSANAHCYPDFQPLPASPASSLYSTQSLGSSEGLHSRSVYFTIWTFCLIRNHRTTGARISLAKTGREHITLFS